MQQIQTTRAFASRILKARVALIEAGGFDDALSEIEAASADFRGNIEAAGQALLAVVESRISELRRSQQTAFAARQEWLNTPENLGLMREMNDCLREADLLDHKARHADAAQKNAQQKIRDLIAQGVSDDAAQAAANRDSEGSPERFRQQATEKRLRAAEIEDRFRVGA